MHVVPSKVPSFVRNNSLTSNKQVPSKVIISNNKQGSEALNITDYHGRTRPEGTSAVVDTFIPYYFAKITFFGAS